MLTPPLGMVNSEDVGSKKARDLFRHVYSVAMG